MMMSTQCAADIAAFLVQMSFGCGDGLIQVFFHIVWYEARPVNKMIIAEGSEKGGFGGTE